MKFARILFFSFCLLFFYFLFLLSPTSFSSEKIRFVIFPEEKTEEAVKKLKKENFLRSEKIFRLLLLSLRFPFGEIEPGAYLLSRRQSAISLAQTLLFHPYQKWVVLPPGLRKEQVAEKMAEALSWEEKKKEEFLKSAQEGYLFPDTYLINLDFSGQKTAQWLFSRFQEKINAELQKALLAQNVRLETAVKIASLIERESGGEEDKALIAGIIWNRLNQGMKLEIDATIQYALGTPGNWWPPLGGKNLREIPSPYNTYIWKGLPPTPIASPSLSSLYAAVYPAETDCLYYLHDHQKRIHCAQTYQEHLSNIEKYLR